ncbi:hypothetical protein KIN20_018536 [Parelaphostrongylus tenuis]|uniref:NTR domain-containing protein n=1 Tax=Parelaphostrongylus tenuis TaxID=148309 RepID=A0AAD5MJJ4_PARTN|nr:hypothetical protein KIN20_018536 [Parelaphostrongylus tenuis]
MIAVYLLALVSTAMACYSCCPPSPLKVTLCAADSVSHVKVISRRNKNDKFSLSDIIYELEHVRVYKKPRSFSTLPSEVYTAAPENCGLHMDVGEEYLLAGDIYFFVWLKSIEDFRNYFSICNLVKNLSTIEVLMQFD